MSEAPNDPYNPEDTPGEAPPEGDPVPQAPDEEGGNDQPAEEVPETAPS